MTLRDRQPVCRSFFPVTGLKAPGGCGYGPRERTPPQWLSEMQ